MVTEPDILLDLAQRAGLQLQVVINGEPALLVLAHKGHPDEYVYATHDRERAIAFVRGYMTAKLDWR